MTSISRSAVRLVAPALLACVTAASVWAPVASASPVRLALFAKPPKRAKHTTTSHARTASKSRRTTTTAAKLSHRAEPAATPKLPDVAALPSIADLLAGRTAAAAAGATGPVAQLVSGSTASVALAPESADQPGAFTAIGASAARLLSSMVERARSQLGTRYVFGGEQPGEGLDCSAFARFAMEAMGIKLPRTAAQQARLGTAVPRDRSKLLPGDLLTFGRGSTVSHVGIYLGDGRFIHASVTSRKIIETTIDRNPRLFRRWQGARRLIATDDTTAKAGEG